MFEPGGGFSHREAHRWYHYAVRALCEQARGMVTISMTEAVPGSVVQDIALPKLKANPHVTLNFIKKV